MKISTNRISTLSLALGLMLSHVGVSKASVSIEFALGDIPGLSDGAVGVLVADTVGDGFTNPADAANTLSVGQTIGGGDDIVIGVLQADASAVWGGQAGFADFLSGIDYSALGVTAGDPLIFYYFPGVTTVGGSTAGQAFESFRSTADGDGGTIPFEAPADGGEYRISNLTGAVGGSYDPANPGPGILPGTPGVISLTELSDSSFRLDWDAIAGATSYEIWRGEDPGALSQYMTSGVNSFTEEGAVPGSRFYYSIVAVNDSGSSGNGTRSISNLGLYGLPDSFLTGYKSARGNNIYGTYGGQTLTYKSKKTRAKNLYINVQNDSLDGQETFRSFSKRGNSSFSVKYTSPAGNVTSQMVTGQLLNTVAAGESVRIKARIKPKSKIKKKRKTLTLPNSTVVDDNATIRDIGKIKFKKLK